ncbi:MAG: hypothetical protein AAGU74_11465 [Bacillota bacterium]
MKSCKKLLCVILLLAALFALGCKAPEDASQSAGSFIKTAMSGGTQMENANAYSLSVQQDGADTHILFGFQIGSRVSGSDAQSPADSVPQYAVSLLSSPARLVVSFDPLAYTDYERTLELSSNLVYGCFRECFVGGTQTNIYFQLSRDAQYQVKESANTLEIILRPDDEEQPKDPPVQYFVMTNAFVERCNGAVTFESGFAPVLCRNLSDVVLLSGAFSTQEEADTFRGATAKTATGILPEQFKTIALYQNDLPIYDEQLDYTPVYSKNVIRVDGTEQTLDVLTPQGLYLCETPDGSGYLFSKAIREAAVGTQDENRYEQLWMYSLDGTYRALLRFEFYAIDSAAYSPDGRRLAVLEQAQEGSHLYVFDVDTNELLADLAEAGFGNTISAFTWDGLGNTIYAISGSSGMQVHQYDFTIPDESKRHSVVDKRGADEGSIAFCEGEIYFVEATLEQGSFIYSIKPEGGVRKQFLRGSAFELSPDKRYLAFTTSGADAVQEISDSQFLIYDFQTKTQKVITGEFDVFDCVWSHDAKRLYFFENRLSGGQTEEGEGGEETTQDTATPADAYPYTLYVYDLSSGETTRIADLSVPRVFASASSDMLYLPYDEDAEGTGIRATYILQSDALTHP